MRVTALKARGVGRGLTEWVHFSGDKTPNFLSQANIKLCFNAFL